MSSLPHSTPEAQGIPSAAISAFVTAVERKLNVMHSFVLVRHGAVVAQGWWEPYRVENPHVLFSLSKSFTSTAIGLLVAEGRLSIDDQVISFFPDETPANPSENLKAMRIRHLLSMSTGHTSEPFSRMEDHPGTTWVELFLMHPVEHVPGTHFLYNSHATYMLSAIVQKLTGGRMVEYLKPRLFDPLGIESLSWEMSPEGIDTGGWGLRLTTSEIARFGQMYLQKGKWNNAQIIPEAWVDQATSFQIDNAPASPDWQQGYCFQFWRCQHNAYRGDGAFGQYCVVMPDQDAVLAITSGMPEMQETLDLVWQYLLPAMGNTPLPADGEAQKALADQLANLKLPLVNGESTSPTAARVSGQVYSLADNPDQVKSIRFDFNDGETVLTLDGGEKIGCGYGEWKHSTSNVPPLDVSLRERTPPEFIPWKIGGSGAWTDATTYTAKLWWVETPFSLTLTCCFSDRGVTITQLGNVGFAPTTGPELSGWIAST